MKKAKAGCPECGDKKEGNAAYCAMHLRFKQMVAAAKHSGKKVPSYRWLEATVPDGMKCPVCRREMNWLRKDGGSTCLTLQHSVDGDSGEETMRMVCHGCRVLGEQKAINQFYRVPEGHRRCKKCTEIKPVEAYYRGHLSCKKCACVEQAKMRLHNVERERERDKKYREKHGGAIKARVLKRQVEKKLLWWNKRGVTFNGTFSFEGQWEIP